MNCNRCGAANRDGSGFCKRCGAPLNKNAADPGQPRVPVPSQDAGMLCPTCGRQIRRDAVFCKYCGASFQGANAAQKDPWLGLRIVLAFLCVGMLIFAGLTVPGKIRERRGGDALPAGQSAAPGQTGPATPTGPAGPGQSTPAPADLSAAYAQIDAMADNGDWDEPEPTMHDEYGWFSGDPEGWVAATEEGGETP